jgi:hypothetical protein
MANSEELGVGKIFLVLAVFLAVGVPIVAIMWNAVNDVVAGDLRRLMVAVPAAAIFVAFLVFFGRQLQRLGSRR